MEITTIEQRAERYADENWSLDEAYYACMDGYIMGANEQIEIACEWLKRYFFNRPCGNNEKLISEFREAMLNNKH